MPRTMHGIIGLVMASAILLAPAASGREGRKKVLGLDRVIAFTYIRKGLDPKKLESVTFVEPTRPADWRDWRERGVVAAIGKTWFDLLRNPADKAVDILLGLDYGGNPRPVVSIDEFGFDFGGQTDAKSAKILRETKRRRPELALTVWEMRGPIPKVLAEAYRDVCDLVMLESYVGGKDHYWWIAAQVQAARFHGILAKSIVALGLGKGGNPGEVWATTPAELEQQIRFVRLIAPESPGVGFFAAGATPELMAEADKLCGRFFDLPTDGSGLPEDVVAVHRLFAGRYARPTLVCCPQWVEPNRSGPNPSKLVVPKTMRAYILNLGDQAARNVAVRLRNPEGKGGDVFAKATVPLIAPRGETIAVLPVTAKWNVWKTWDMEVDAPGATVHILRK